jgi:hypothetical protein
MDPSWTQVFARYSRLGRSVASKTKSAGLLPSVPAIIERAEAIQHGLGPPSMSIRRQLEYGTAVLNAAFVGGAACSAESAECFAC